MTRRRRKTDHVHYSLRHARSSLRPSLRLKVGGKKTNVGSSGGIGLELVVVAGAVVGGDGFAGTGGGDRVAVEGPERSRRTAW